MAELPTLAQGTMPSFTPPAEDRDSASSLLRGALGDQFSGIGNLMDRKAKADEEAVRLEQEQKKSELERKAKDYGTYVEGIKTKYKQAEPALMAAPPKFNVTKDTEEGLTGLAALMTVGSLIVGSKGATSGVNAMNAMTGVLKGYQEGNQQRIDFETKKYEQSIKDWERNLQQTKDALSRYEKMAALDLNKATAEAAAYAASQGQDVIAAKIRSGTIGDAIKMVQNLQQQTATAKTQWATINGQTGLYSPAEVRAAQEAGLPVAQAQKGGATRSALARQFDDQVTISVNEAATQIKNMTNLPFATSGLYGGQRPEGFFKAPLGVLANTLTPGSVQQYNNNVQGLGFELAKMLGGGRAVPVSTQKAFADRFQINMGDAPFTVLEKLGNMRQSFEKGIEVKIASADTPTEMKEIYARALKDIQSSIPFTVADVLEAQQKAALGKGKKLETFGDFMQKKMGGREIAEEPKPQAQTSGKKSAENRFNELEASGMSEADIFKKMQGEGY